MKKFESFVTKYRYLLLTVTILLLAVMQLMNLGFVGWTYLLAPVVLFGFVFQPGKAPSFIAAILTLVAIVLEIIWSQRANLDLRWSVIISFGVITWILALFIGALKKLKIRVEAKGKRYNTLSKNLSKKLEDELSSEVDKAKRESSALKLAIRSGGIGIWDWDLDTNELHWDDQMFLLYGKSKGGFEVNYHNWENCVLEEDRNDFSFGIQDAIRGAESCNLNFRIIWPDNSIRHIKMLGYVERDKSNKALRIVGTNWDISQDKQMENALVSYKDQLEEIVERRTNVMQQLNENLLRNEDLLDQMSEISKIGGWEYSADTKELNWTKEVFKIHGLDKEQAPSLEESLSFFSPEVKGLVQRSYNNCVGRKEEFELEVPFITAKENRIWVRVIGKPRIRKGQIIGMSGVIQDITSEKELKENLIKINEELDRDLAKKTELLKQSTQEMETFSYTVSHDLRTPLRAIEGFSKALQDNYAGILDEDGDRWLKYIVDNTNKMGVLITDILAYSRVQRSEIQEEELNMNKLLEEKFDEVKQFYREKVIKINVEKLPRVTGDRNLVGQIWLNLLDNALKFSSENEEIKIEVRGKIENEMCLFTVSDKGVGFDQRYVDKIFVIFQRLHGEDEFKGSGVGLAIVERIIKKHGGWVSAEAELNKGASVTFALPV